MRQKAFLAGNRYLTQRGETFFLNIASSKILRARGSMIDNLPEGFLFTYVNGTPYILGTKSSNWERLAAIDCEEGGDNFVGVGINCVDDQGILPDEKLLERFLAKEISYSQFREEVRLKYRGFAAMEEDDSSLVLNCYEAVLYGVKLP